MLKTVKEIAKVRSGQTFRKRVSNSPDGEVYAIQIKDLNEQFTDFCTTPHKVSKDEITSSQLLNTGDILFLGKGNTNKAFVYKKPEAAVAVSLFFIIQVKGNSVLPGYLAWYLNSYQGQAALERIKSGGLVGNIRKSDLEDLVIPVPGIEIQNQIININNLFLKEKELLAKLELKKTQYIESVLNRLINP
ncbi:restriction endonuclease subunit S [Robertkochia solimangrovi]|uniref:restriction endonuclease subunit S n=1 Tax=Robertkochia solimangrovi TaxID=2213046 RepID=UPI00117FFB8E|nr:restriction endonuclease subunit S [Robertkochia solimangrovi]TRZ41666.1 hypothetical protein DMZ48_16800 [Robertkochia solimangrovi]